LQLSDLSELILERDYLRGQKKSLPGSGLDLDSDNLDPDPTKYLDRIQISVNSDPKR